MSDGGARAAPAELEFHRLLDKLPAGAYTCDRKGLITYFNRQAVEVWGRAPKLHDPVDRFCGSFKLFDVEGRPIVHERCWMAMALHSNQGFNGCEIVIERPDGSRITALAHANPIHDEDGRLLGAVNVLVDISERKRLEIALREADRSKDEFLATLAHELRNPLAPLRNAIQVLRMRIAASSPDEQWAIEVAERQLQQMTRLIDDLLDISRITCNRLELQKEPVVLENVLRVAVETSRPLIDAAGHELVLELERQGLLVEADLTRLAQALANLLNNAAKYTPEGGRIVVRAERQGSDAVISISDNGIGITGEMLPRIFEIFTQGDQNGARSNGGLGIGLSLVKRIIELHAGSIQARSDGPGTGSTFVVRLPVLIERAPRRRKSALSGAGMLPGSALRILVADDSRDSANTLAMLLRITGNTVRTTYDGQEALEAIEEFQPDVALLDIGMPRMSGYEVAQRIREHDGGGRIVLIALTGWGQEQDKQRSREAGFDHHMIKPIEPPALLDLLARLRPAAFA